MFFIPGGFNSCEKKKFVLSYSLVILLVKDTGKRVRMEVS